MDGRKESKKNMRHGREANTCPPNETANVQLIGRTSR